MNYEQKYKESLERAEKLYEQGTITESLNYIFPELKDSEDERIRKHLISLVKNWDKDGIFSKYTSNPNDIKKILAWLEKQGCHKEFTFKSIPRLLEMIEPTNRAKSYCQKLIDSLLQEGYATDAKIVGDCLKQMKGEKVAMATMNEQKPADKVEPKFHIGDLIVNKSGFAQQVLDFRCGIYICTYSNFSTNYESNYHLWSIEDAKDGDVLYYKSDNNIEYIVMNKGINMYGNIDSYFRYNSLDGFAVDVPDVLSAKKDNITLATKEQRELLFQKMKEVGYEWNDENKELKKIEPKSDVWTEQDKKILEGIIDEIEVNKNEAPSYDLPTYDKYLNWLKSLKNKIKND